jgi:hypothetical protein
MMRAGRAGRGEGKGERAWGGTGAGKRMLVVAL